MVIAAVSSDSSAWTERLERNTDPGRVFQSATEVRGEPHQTVQAKRTPLTAAQAQQALARAFTQTTGETPSPRTLAILTAQWAHETGNGASMYNYNFGGIKGRGPSGLSVAQRTREGWGANERQIVDRFRAYVDADQGALDYVQLLQRRFPAALEAARQGNPEGFVRQLKARGYFTGSEQAYARSIGTLANQIASGDTPWTAQTGRAAPTTPTGRDLQSVTASEQTNLLAAAAPRPLTLDTQTHLGRTGPLVPEALLDGLSGSTGENPKDGPWTDTSLALNTASALGMADEVARAALLIAVEERRPRELRRPAGDVG